MTLSNTETQELLKIIKERFEDNMYLHVDVNWQDVESKLLNNPDKLQSLWQMEETGGEPNIVTLDGSMIFYDTSIESPKGRRSLCYDSKALKARKKNKPLYSALNMAREMGVEIFSEEIYRNLQKFFNFDLKTSSWIKTPEQIRDLGGALFCDNRYKTTFTYHNSAESYYSSRGFRAYLEI